MRIEQGQLETLTYFLLSIRKLRASVCWTKLKAPFVIIPNELKLFWGCPFVFWGGLFALGSQLVVIRGYLLLTLGSKIIPGTLLGELHGMGGGATNYPSQVRQAPSPLSYHSSP